jgi:hypothetical protein
MSEVYRYATQQVINAGKQPTLNEVRQHFAGEGKELLIVEVSPAEARLLCYVGIGTYDHGGRRYAVATITSIRKRRRPTEVV